MKKQLAAIGAATALLLGGFTSTAWAETTNETSTEVCVPQEAQPAQGEPTIEIDNPDYVPEQTIEHPAEGEPTIPNPDYIPAKDAVYETVQHPAEYETVHHEAEYTTVEHPAVTHTEYQFKHFLTGKIKWSSNPNWNADWNLESIGFFKTGVTKEVIDEPAWTEEVLVKEAYDEQVLVKEAWEEEVLVSEATPAVGDETIPNPNYKAPWTETKPAVGDPKITVDNPEYVPAQEANDCRDGVSTSIQTRCLDGTVYLAIQVDNNTGGPLDIRSSLTGDHTIEAGKAFYQSYNQRTDSLEAGRVVMVYRNAGGSWGKVLRYSAIECEVTPPPTTEPPVEEEPAVTPPTSNPTVAKPVTIPVAIEPSVVQEPAKEQPKLSAAQSDELATTGAEVIAYGGLAAVLIVAGAVILVTRLLHRRTN